MEEIIIESYTDNILKNVQEINKQLVNKMGDHIVYLQNENTKLLIIITNLTK